VKKLIYSKHAVIRMKQRKITPEDILDVVEDPELVEEQEYGCLRCYKYSEKHGSAIRIVIRGELVITVMHDRSFKRRLK